MNTHTHQVKQGGLAVAVRGIHTGIMRDKQPEDFAAAGDINTARVYSWSCVAGDFLMLQGIPAAERRVRAAQTQEVQWAHVVICEGLCDRQPWGRYLAGYNNSKSFRND